MPVKLPPGAVRERGRSYRTEAVDVPIHALDPSVELAFTLLSSEEPAVAHGLLARYGSGAGQRIELAFVRAFVADLAVHLGAGVLKTGPGPLDRALVMGGGARNGRG